MSTDLQFAFCLLAFIKLFYVFDIFALLKTLLDEKTQSLCQLIKMKMVTTKTIPLSIFSSYILFLTLYSPSINKSFWKKLLFLEKKSIYYTNLNKNREKTRQIMHIKRKIFEHIFWPKLKVTIMLFFHSNRVLIASLLSAVNIQSTRTKYFP